MQERIRRSRTRSITTTPSWSSRDPGERFVGKARFQAFREEYPAEKPDFKIRRISGSADHWVAENLIRYNDGDWMFTVNIVHFRDDKVAREWIYIMDGWEAPDWREPYREMFDPLSVLE
jgi:hypothetical protein